MRRGTGLLHASFPLPFLAGRPAACVSLSVPFSLTAVPSPFTLEFVIDQNWRAQPVANLSHHLVQRAYRRYGLAAPEPLLAEAWVFLTETVYAKPVSDLDPSGVKYFPAWQSQFETDRRTPTPDLCKVFAAWENFVAVASAATPTGGDLQKQLQHQAHFEHQEQLANHVGLASLAQQKTFRYDLVNLVRMHANLCFAALVPGIFPYFSIYVET